jgi:hypothetical protein
MAASFTESLRHAWARADSLLCVGLDPDPARIPPHLAHRPDAILHLGIAGARRASGLQIGDVVIGTLSQYSDLAAAVPTTRTIEPDADLLERIGVLLPDAHRLPIATSAYVGGGDCAGLVLGAQVPIVLTSRADSLQSRMASVALAVLAAVPA